MLVMVPGLLRGGLQWHGQDRINGVFYSVPQSWVKSAAVRLSFRGLWGLRYNPTAPTTFTSWHSKPRRSNVTASTCLTTYQQEHLSSLHLKSTGKLDHGRPDDRIDVFFVVELHTQPRAFCPARHLSKAKADPSNLYHRPSSATRSTHGTVAPARHLRRATSPNSYKRPVIRKCFCQASAKGALHDHIKPTQSYAPAPEILLHNVIRKGPVWRSGWKRNTAFPAAVIRSEASPTIWLRPSSTPATAIPTISCASHAE